MRKKVCVVTGSRSEYGLLYNSIKLINSSRKLELLLAVTGMHLSPEFGYTVKEIENNGFKISKRVKMIMSSNDPAGVAKSIGVGTIGFVDAFKRLKPDVVLILGDRYEIFAAVTAAVVMNLPVAHISGGDITEGVIDEQMRHAITKMSHIHFVAMKKHAQRLRKMGEEAWRINIVGEPCIDNINSMKRLPKKKLEKMLGFKLSYPTLIVTFHPVTLHPKESSIQVKNLLSVLDKINAKIIFTYPNADAGGRTIIREIKRFIKNHSNTVAFKSLGSHLYLNLLENVDLIIGNSSSAVVEAPSFKLPAVNIGNRQKGRLIPRNVICASGSIDSISKSIKKALSQKFKSSLLHMNNPYNKGGAAKKIVRVLSNLKSAPLLVNKKFAE